MGLEPDLKLYVEHIGMVLSELKRVIKPTGSIFLNLGDSYNTVSGSGKIYGNLGVNEDKYNISWFKKNIIGTQKIPRKSLMNIPSRVAIMATDNLGLSERNDIAWVKPNGLPGGWADRLTVRKEVIYHFVKRSKYYYNLDNIREPYSDASIKRAQSPLLHDKEAYMGQLPSMNRWYGKIKKKHDGSKYNDKQYTSINERKNAERD